VLEVIDASPGNLAPVFDAIVEKAMRLCDASFGGMWLLEGDRMLPVGGRNLPAPYLEYLTREPIPPTQIFGRAARRRPFIHIADLTATQAYRERIPLTVASVELGGIETFLGVTLRDGGAVVGLLVLYRTQERLFTDSQISLVQAFAAQAQIAMKNARLFNETQEALERQTATAVILKVIAGSPSDTKPVFDSICFTAVRSLRCDGAFVLMRDRDVFIHSAGATPQGPMTDLAPDRVPIDPDANFPSRAILARETLYLPDWSQIDLPAHERNIHAAFGVSSALYLPLLREGECIGAIGAFGSRPNAFGLKEIAQAESFRDQAAIAIQNARLFEEVQAKTRDLEESLAQQTATADVLKVISRSAFDLDAVLETLVNSMRQLCSAPQGMILLRDGDRLRMALQRGYPLTFERYVVENPAPPAPNTGAGRAAFTRSVVHMPDVLADSQYDFSEGQRLGQYRAMLSVPMLRENQVVGVFSLRRPTPGPFTPRQIELVQTFADQAVIAIENARLFGETQAALERDRASAEILTAVSQSVADAQPVFEQIADACARLFGSSEVAIFRVDDDGLVLMAARRGRLMERARNDVTPLDQSYTGRAARAGEVLHIRDYAQEPGLSEAMRERAKLDNSSAFYAPILAEGRVLGSIGVLGSRRNPSAKKSSPSPRPSPIRRRSPSRTRGCSTK
jgi:GAF domain-containing protein